MALAIMVPKTDRQLDEVRLLMRAFIKWHRESNPAEIDLIDRYFDSAEFENELASLPGKYAPPQGQLLLATWDDKPAGCVAMRKLDAKACEMKRMFVYTEFHGKGIGRALANELLQEARAMNFQYMRLDTSIRQTDALGLYERLGFQFIDPYYELPQELQGWLVFMELKLQP